jgi:hypothetical protein
MELRSIGGKEQVPLCKFSYNRKDIVYCFRIYSYIFPFYITRDYTNPDAMKWWHSQMDAIIALGIDGWKCDGTDPFLYELGGIAKGYGGFITEVSK